MFGIILYLAPWTHNHIFSDYEFIGDQEVARSAAVSSRYTDSSLRGVIQVLHGWLMDR